MDKNDITSLCAQLVAFLSYGGSSGNTVPPKLREALRTNLERVIIKESRRKGIKVENVMPVPTTESVTALIEPLSAPDIAVSIKYLPMTVMDSIQEFPNSVFIAGGWVRDAIAGAPQKDIDIWCVNSMVRTRFIRALLRRGWKTERTSRYADTLGWHPSATGFAGDIFLAKVPPVQVMHNPAGGPRELISGFDFTVCQAAIWFNEKSHWDGVISEQGFRDIRSNTLQLAAPSNYNPLGGWASVYKRMIEFTSRGMNPTMETVAILTMRSFSDFQKNPSHLTPWSVEEELAFARFIDTHHSYAVETIDIGYGGLGMQTGAGA